MMLTGVNTEPLATVTVLRKCFGDEPEVPRVTFTRDENAGMVVLKL